MPGDRFFDTNILIYAFAAADHRSARAEALMAEGGVIGVQVLNEFTSVVRRKLSWDWPQVDAALEVIAELMGHTNPSITTGRYGKRYQPLVLLEAVRKLDFGVVPVK